MISASADTTIAAIRILQAKHVFVDSTERLPNPVFTVVEVADADPVAHRPPSEERTPSV